MAINLKTNCNNCIHANVCRNHGQAAIFEKKLKSVNYGDGPNNDYDFGAMSNYYHVNIDISCYDYCERVSSFTSGKIREKND